MIPLKDYPGERRTFPWVMLTILGVNVLVFLYELFLTTEQQLNNLFLADGVVPV